MTGYSDADRKWLAEIAEMAEIRQSRDRLAPLPRYHDLAGAGPEVIKVILPGSIRSKKNSKRIFARGKMKTVLPSKAYVQWEKDARQCAKIQARLDDLIKTSVSVCVTAYYKGQRPDLSGALESIGDALEGVIWENDRQVESWDGSRLIHDLEYPRTEVVIKDFS